MAFTLSCEESGSPLQRRSVALAAFRFGLTQWVRGAEGERIWKPALYTVYTQQFVTVKNHLFLGITILRGEIIASVQHKTSI